MTKFCESCHTANRDRAKYCRGCAGKFSGLRTAANVTETSVAEGRPARAGRVPRSAPPLRVSMPIPVPAAMPQNLPALSPANDLFIVPRTFERRELARQTTLPGGLDIPV